MANFAKRRATYQDVLQAPSGKVAEVLAGDLYLSPRPATPHAMATSTIVMDVGSAFQRGRGGPGGWWILDEPELHFDEEILVPDLAGWRKERMPTLPSMPFIELAPDWVCEALSPSTARTDRVLKVPICAAQGVRHVWLVDPEAQTLEVLKLEGSSYLIAATFGGVGKVRAEPFDAIELELGALWPHIRETTE